MIERIKEDFQNLCGAESPEEAREFSRKVTLDGVAENIRCPLLIVHGRLDVIAPRTRPSASSQPPRSRRRSGCLKKETTFARTSRRSTGHGSPTGWPSACPSAATREKSGGP